MSDALRTLRRMLGIGLTWAILWSACWAIVGVTIGIIDPDSIDPGEGLMAVAILGPMGVFSGVAFGTLLSIWGPSSTSTFLSQTRVAGLGIVGSAIVQLAYLDHGDLGLAANIKMALVFCVFGGVVTMVWLVIARRFAREQVGGRSAASAAGSR